MRGDLFHPNLCAPISIFVERRFLDQAKKPIALAISIVLGFSPHESNLLKTPQPGMLEVCKANSERKGLNVDCLSNNAPPAVKFESIFAVNVAPRILSTPE